MDKCLTISVPEAGKLLGIGRCTAYKLVRDGSIPAVRLGKQLRIPRAAIRAMLEVHANGDGREN